MNRAHWSALPDDWSEDEKLAGHYLAGWLEKIDGRIVHKYFEPGSDEEKAAHAAFCRCLWDWHNPTQRPLPDAIRVRLRALHEGIDEDRKITIEHRDRRRSTRAWTRILIAEHVAAERKKVGNKEIAIENTAKEFGVSESTVKRALPRPRRKRKSRNKK